MTTKYPDSMARHLLRAVTASAKPQEHEDHAARVAEATALLDDILALFASYGFKTEKFGVDAKNQHLAGSWGIWHPTSFSGILALRPNEHGEVYAYWWRNHQVEQSKFEVALRWDRAEGGFYGHKVGERDTTQAGAPYAYASPLEIVTLAVLKEFELL